MKQKELDALAEVIASWKTRSEMTGQTYEYIMKDTFVNELCRLFGNEGDTRGISSPRFKEERFRTMCEVGERISTI